MKNRKKLYIIRHGETDFNRLGVVQGSGVDAPLNELGRKQARQFYENYKHISFDKIYISALKRTRQSVEQFIEAGIPFEVFKGLNEISWGIYEGLQGDASWKEDYHHMIRKWGQDEHDLHVPGGENPNQLQARQREVLQKIMEMPDEENVLICMHGRAMKSFLCLLLGKSLNEMESFHHSNLCLYVLEYTGDGFSLLKTNAVDHL